MATLTIARRKRRKIRNVKAPVEVGGTQVVNLTELHGFPVIVTSVGTPDVGSLELQPPDILVYVDDPNATPLNMNIVINVEGSEDLGPITIDPPEPDPSPTGEPWADGTRFSDGTGWVDE